MISFSADSYWYKLLSFVTFFPTKIKLLSWLRNSLMKLAKGQTERLYISLRGLYSVMQENPDKVINMKLCKIIDKLETTFDVWDKKIEGVLPANKYEKEFVELVRNTKQILTDIQNLIISYSFSWDANSETNFYISCSDWDSFAKQIYKKS